MSAHRLSLALALFGSMLFAGLPAFAGITLISHGFVPVSSQPPGWTRTMGQAILEKVEGDTTKCGDLAGTEKGSILEYQPSTGAWALDCGSSSPSEHIVLIFNWASDSDVNLEGYRGFAEGAGDTLYAALRDPQLPAALAGVNPLAETLHFIGHSRGTVVNSDCLERLATAGISIDQVTTIDPHPNDGTLDYPLAPLSDWLDRAPVYWSNISFADNYYRQDGNAADFDGMPLSDVDYEEELGINIEQEAVGDPPLEHIETHAWYHGTIEIGAMTDGNGTLIDQEPPNPWYDGTNVPVATMTGHYFSAVGAGTASRSTTGTTTRPSYSPTLVYNGDFENVVVAPGIEIGLGKAGWVYHGGSELGIVTVWNSVSPPPTPAGNTYYLTLANGATDSIRHNRMYVDSSIERISMDFRVFASSANDVFRVVISDGTSSKVLGIESLTGTTLWKSISFLIPKPWRGESSTLTFELVDSGGGTATDGAVVDVDNIVLTATQLPMLSVWGLSFLLLSLSVATLLAARRARWV